MRFFLIIFFVLISFCCKSQICNFCDIITVKNMLKEDGLRYNESENKIGETKLVVTGGFYDKIWYFRYGKCCLYEVVVYKRNYFRSMVKVLNQQYVRKSKTFWEDSNNRILLSTKKGKNSFCFYSKNSIK